MAKNKFFLFVILFFFPRFSFAVCPVCTVAVGAGVGLCRYLGIDDLISGTWLGGLLMSLSLWTIDWLNKRNIKFLFRKPLILLFWFGITIFILSQLGIVGQPENKFLGFDKLVFGIISGGATFLLSVFFHNFLVKKNKGKVFFPFQKVAIPILFLLILSIVFNLVC